MQTNSVNVYLTSSDVNDITGRLVAQRLPRGERIDIIYISNKIFHILISKQVYEVLH